MRIVTEDGYLHPSLEDDVRILAKQEDIMQRVAKTDPLAEVIGMDARLLPVVRARLGGSRTPTDFVIWPKGRTDVPEMPLREEWVVDGR